MSRMKERRLRSTDTFGSERARDASAARRQVEELGQNDRIIALLERQNELMEYIAERLHTMETQRTLV